MDIRKIHHAAIICSDYKRSKQFYTEVLKLEILSETYRAERDSYKLDLRVGDRDQIELFSFPNAPARSNYPEAQGLRHLAFEVLDIEVAVQELEEQGVLVEQVRVDEGTGRRFTFFNDPDGLLLELYERA
ncbi:VOC family protein [Domibacillus enclensis]|uniref:Glyoxylase I family protein n=1 Tax=Domibacillus enclensis TaxID=1017273 RepID=A0A1N6RRY8_9BACI|nr:VOC family protein [Domibacillus enclensis]OXS79128.1 VOC family protein [Domibacillus enclensis]SIQ31630.1 glyoxylase I family protein [Domibacillus enclensis]